MSSSRRFSIRLFLILTAVLVPLHGPVGAETPQSLRGSVRQDDGRPKANASVRVFTVPSNHSIRVALHERRWPPAAPLFETQTDVDGLYTIALPAGLWRLEVHAPGHLAMLLPVIEHLDGRTTVAPVQLHRATSSLVEIVDREKNPRSAVGLRATSDDPTWETTHPWRPAPRIGWTDSKGRLRLSRAAGEALHVSIHPSGSIASRTTTVPGPSRVVLHPDESQRRVIFRDHSTTGPLHSDVLVAVAGQPWPIGRADPPGVLSISAPDGHATSLVGLTQDHRVARVAFTNEQSPVVAHLEPAILIRQRVVDPKGFPIPGAWVWPRHEPAAAVRADSAGRVAIQVNALTPVRLEARAPGFVPRHRIDSASGVDLTLTASPARHGRVVDNAGKPIVGAMIVASARTSARTSRSHSVLPVSPTLRDLSDQQGRFTLKGLPVEATAKLSVTKAGWGRADAVLPRRSPEPSPSTTAIDIILPRGRIGFGQVLDLNERPIPNAEITLRATVDDEGPSSDQASQVTGHGISDGRFEIVGVPDGRLTLLVRAAGFAAMVVRGLTVPTGSHAVDLGTVLLAPGHTIAGLVRDEHGKPIAGARVEVARAEPLEPQRSRSVASGSIESDDAGRFIVPDLAKGIPINLRIDAPGWMRAETTVTAPRQDPLVVTLHPAAEIAGTVVDSDNQPITGATIVVWPATPNNRSYAPRSIATDQRGAFVLHDLEEGRFEIEIEAAGYQPPPPANFETTAGEQRKLPPIVLRRGAILTGTVVASDQSLVADAIVTVGRARGRSDESGRFRIDGVPIGRATIEGRHPSYNHASRTLEIEPGANETDLMLEGGHALRGHVVDHSDHPIANVALRLAIVEGSAPGGYRSRSDQDGTFEVPSVADGRYRVHVDDNDYIVVEPTEAIVVAGADLSEVMVRLQAGAQVEGMILGLDFDDRANVRVTATAEGQGQRLGDIDFDGAFRISNLPANDWLLTATVDQGRRQARARVRVGARDTLVHQDLEFGHGVVLTGVVLLDDEPLAAANVTLRNRRRPVERGTITDADGRFSIADLDEGTYRIAVASRQPSVVHNLDIDLVGDRDMTIQVVSATLRGRAFDQTTGEPLADVMILIEQALDQGRGSVHAKPTNVDGRFQFQRLPAGPYHVTTQRDGYRPLERTVHLPPGATPRDLDLALDRTAGLTVAATLTSGVRPQFVTLFGQSEEGQTFRATRVADAQGQAHFASLPAGAWRLRVSAPGAAAIPIRANVPGEPQIAVLPTAGPLHVRVPALAGSDSLATVTVVGHTGHPFERLAPGGTIERVWPMVAGHVQVPDLPAGSWTVTVRDPSRTWTATTTTTGGPPIEVVVE